jgi:glucosamine kinase
MILVVDSGSTKSDWRVIGDCGSTAIATKGLNPIFVSADIIKEEVMREVVPQVATEEVTKIYFYGSGCWDDHLQGIISNALAAVFTNAAIEVKHDLLGAARATCGHHPGISCIIGTGSNSCLYDGKEVVDNITNLGYLLGDEGSGTHLGKKLIAAYFYRELPEELSPLLDDYFPGGKQSILDKIYGPETPNVFLAAFTRFIHQHRKHPYLQHLVYESFSEFIDRHVRKYSGHLGLPIHFIGSIAYYFQDNLKLVLQERNMNVGTFIKKPIGALADYHLANEVINQKV